MAKLFASPGRPWIIGALIACVLMLATLAFPLWKMELIAPQYPEGLTMYAYGYKFASSDASHYDDIHEINGLNHYIGMKPIEEVTEMQLFIPGVIALVVATLLVSFIAWKRRWLRAGVVAAFWFFPVFFLADLQYWLYHYGHTMDPDAPLNPGAFTPKVIGTTEVWNFHSVNSVQTGFYLMVLAAVTITFLPLAIRLARRWLASRKAEADAKRTGTVMAGEAARR